MPETNLQREASFHITKTMQHNSLIELFHLPLWLSLLPSFPPSRSLSLSHLLLLDSTISCALKCVFLSLFVSPLHTYSSPDTNGQMTAYLTLLSFFVYWLQNKLKQHHVTKGYCLSFNRSLVSLLFLCFEGNNSWCDEKHTQCIGIFLFPIHPYPAHIQYPDCFINIFISFIYLWN